MIDELARKCLLPHAPRYNGDVDIDGAAHAVDVGDVVNVEVDEDLWQGRRSNDVLVATPP